MTFNSSCMQKRTGKEKTGNGPSVPTVNRLPLKRLAEKEGIENWDICKIYEKVINDGRLSAYQPQFLANTYGVSAQMIRRWQSGATPHSWRTYLLSKDPDLAKLSIDELAEKYGVCRGSVFKIREMAGLTEEYKKKVTIKHLVLNHPELGRMRPEDMAKELGCTSRTVWRYMREKGIKLQKQAPLFKKTKLPFVESMMMRWK